MPKILTVQEARDISMVLLGAMGVSERDAAVICDSMDYADMRGKTTHGMGRLPLYHHNIQAGSLDPSARIELVADANAICILDAHNGFGQVAAQHAVETGIERARSYGIAAVGVRNSNNFGAAGYYGLLCAGQGMAALIMANASPALAPTGGNKPLIGTNPICFAAPGTETTPPIVFDMSVTNAARSKVRLAEKNGKSIPEGWAVDVNGNPTTNPSEALRGSMLPLGGYKGYGLGLMVDIMAGLLTGSAYAGGVKPFSDLSGPSRNGHLFIVINIAAFCAEGDYIARYEHLVSMLRSCGNDVLLPGERGLRRQAEGCGEIKLSDKQWEEIAELAATLGISGLTCK